MFHEGRVSVSIVTLLVLVDSALLSLHMYTFTLFIDSCNNVHSCSWLARWSFVALVQEPVLLCDFQTATVLLQMLECCACVCV